MFEEMPPRISAEIWGEAQAELAKIREWPSEIDSELKEKYRKVVQAKCDKAHMAPAEKYYTSRKYINTLKKLIKK